MTMSGDGDDALDEPLMKSNSNNPVGSIYFNLCGLAIAWALTLTTSTLLTTIGPISAQSLGASDSMSSFTVGIFLFGAAISSVPSSWLFRNYGRYYGFLVGCISQLIGSFLGYLAMTTNQLYLLYISCLCVGLGQGLGQFYRFVAIEVCADSDLKSKAITYVLSGGIIAAFLGPTCAQTSVDLLSKKYCGSFIIMGVIGLINTLTINAINFPTMSRSDDLTSVILYGPKRPLVEIMMQPSFIISCSCATLAHTIMIMIMSDVELAMSADDFSLYYCSLVMELHFLAMFSPGFISGYLIDSLGSLFVAIVGGIIFAASLLVMGLGQNLFNYTFGMILVGIGWNLSFSTGTVMLTSSYNRNEATDVQAVNDFFLFSIAGSSSFLSGYIYEEYGWVFLIYIMAVFVACYLTLFFAAWYLQTGRNKENDDKILVTANIDNNSIASYRSVSSVSQHDRDDNVSVVRTISVA